MIQLSRREDGGVDFPLLMRRRRLILGALLVCLAGTAIFSMMVGTVGPIGPGEPDRVSFEDAFRVIFRLPGERPDYYERVFWDVRIPRVLLAGLVGAALACAGTAMQAVFRNPMADPFIVGVSTGASLGAVTASLMGLAGVAIIGSFISPAFAFATALVTVFIVYRLGTVSGKVYVDTLLLSGVAVAAFLGAIVSFMIYYARQEYHRLVFWLLGSLSLSTWPAVAVLFIVVVIGATVVFLFGRDLNALLLGEETAHNLGTDPERLKTDMLVAAAVMTAAAVAFTGVIGFVGLIVPHMVRLVVGADHRMLVPSATVTGAIFLILADSAARTVVAPTELPVGIITAMCGGPFFIYLLRRSRTGGERT